MDFSTRYLYTHTANAQAGLPRDAAILLWAVVWPVVFARRAWLVALGEDRPDQVEHVQLSEPVDD